MVNQVKKKKNDYTKEKEAIRGINENIRYTSYFFSTMV